MKLRSLGFLALVLFSLPLYAAKIKGSRVGANEKSAGFFVEAFSSKGRVLYKSVKLDADGKFEIDFDSNEGLVYWIDNFPVYAKPDDHLEILLPERKNGVFMIGGSNENTPSAQAAQKAKENIKLLGKSSLNHLLIYDVNTSWASLTSDKKGLQTIDEINNLYATVSKTINAAKHDDIKNFAAFYNDMRYLEAKLQFIRAHPVAKLDRNYFNVLNKISLNHPAVSSLKSIGLRALITNYYAFLKLNQGAKITDEDLSDNGSIGKMQYLLGNVSNERVINEELNQSIIYHLSIKGWNPELDKIMVAAIEKTTDATAKKNLLDWREKYSKVSKNAMAPGFSIPDASGKIISLSDFKGKVVAIDVWATWCIPCMHSLPYFLKLRNQYKDNSNVVFISISTDNSKSKDKWLNFLKSKNMNGIELHAGDEKSSAFEKAYNITGIPRYILIDQEGRIIEDHAPQASEPAFEALIEKALKFK